MEIFFDFIAMRALTLVTIAAIVLVLLASLFSSTEAGVLRNILLRSNILDDDNLSSGKFSLYFYFYCYLLPSKISVLSLYLNCNDVDNRLFDKTEVVLFKQIHKRV